LFVFIFDVEVSSYPWANHFKELEWKVWQNGHFMVLLGRVFSTSSKKKALEWE
jgi:NADH:ubiquinone oxidoreductase subunit 3 (subunit A)